MILHAASLQTRWAEAFGASALLIFNDRNASFTAFVADSRKAAAGTCFFALKGETQNGHAFAEAACRAGASGLVVQKGALDTAYLAQAYPECWIAEVPDTAIAFREAARLWRNAFHGPVVLIAGSVGKTTTKEWLAHVLEHSLSILKTEGSQNGVLGIPATLSRLESRHQIALIEVGIDAPGAMAEHVDLVRPTHALLTAIGPEHLEQLIDLDTVTREELLAFSSTSLNTVYYQLDDDRIRPAFHLPSAPHQTRVRRLAVSLNQHEGATLRGDWNPPNLALSWERDSTDLVVTLPLPGRAMAQNAALVALVAKDLGADHEALRVGLQTFSAAPGRMEIRKLGTQTWLCDTYNSQPSAALAALETFAGIPQSDRIICLGDMLELGPQELEFHRVLAAPVKSCRPRAVLLLGTRMKALFEKLQDQGTIVEHFTEVEALTARLRSLLQKNTAILLKGSRSMRMERVWKAFFSENPSA